MDSSAALHDIALLEAWQPIRQKGRNDKNNQTAFRDVGKARDSGKGLAGSKGFRRKGARPRLQGPEDDGAKKPQIRILIGIFESIEHVAQLKS